MSKLLERFLTYVRFDTQSNPGSEETPSTDKQWALARYLKEEMEVMGLENVRLDDHCCLMATLPGNTDKRVPAIGFIAHLDTACDYPGANVKPQIIEKYDGSDIALNDSMTLSVRKFPELDSCLNKTVITTDGTTLLGADDKAGIAEILTAVDYLLDHPEIKHGDIHIAFTPDEEIGRGADHFDVEAFAADFAYTVDGGQLGEMQYENFNASQATITVHGRSVHPGYAKDKMLNSMLVAADFIRKMPPDETPANTNRYDGFFHLNGMESSVRETKMQWLIRDFDSELHEYRKALVVRQVRWFNEKYGDGTIELEIEDNYRNMREVLEDKKEVITLAREAMKQAGVRPLIRPIRGGTDGSKLSFKGLPCPNIFTGGYNFHGPYEFIALEDMEKAVEVIVNIARLAAES